MEKKKEIRDFETDDSLVTAKIKENVENVPKKPRNNKKKISKKQQDELDNAEMEKAQRRKRFFIILMSTIIIVLLGTVCNTSHMCMFTQKELLYLCNDI